MLELKDSSNTWLYCPYCNWSADAPNIGLPNKCPDCLKPGLSYYGFSKSEFRSVIRLLGRIDILNNSDNRDIL